MLFEKVIEVGRIFEPERVRNLGDAPFGVQQQRLGFLNDTLSDVLGERLSSGFSHGAVEMVGVQPQVDGKIICGL